MELVDVEALVDEVEILEIEVLEVLVLVVTVVVDVELDVELVEVVNLYSGLSLTGARLQLSNA